MTTVSLDFRIPDASGVDKPVAQGSYVEFTPTAIRDLEGWIVLPEPFKRSLNDGTGTVVLAPSLDGTWAWRADVHAVGYTATWYKSVPASGTVDFDDLVDVDPDTLDPTVTPTPGWQVYVDAQIAALGATVVKDGDGAGGALSGSYPNPGFAVDMAQQSELDAVAAAKVNKAGDTMSGALAINKTAALMIDLLRSDNGANNKRWKVNVQANGDVTLDYYNDADAYVATLLKVQRSGLGGSIGGSQFINFTGSPEGVFTAGIGTHYIDTNATGGIVDYVKTTASGTTGWVSWQSLLSAQEARLIAFEVAL